MKKIIPLIFCLGILFSSFSLPTLAMSTKSKTTINVYNWGEFISNGTDGSLDVNKEFTKRTGIEVNYTTFQSNEELYAKLISGGANYDVIIPSDYMIGKLIQNDMIKKLNFNNIPNASMIDDRFKNLSYDPTNEYSVPYTWGTVGIFYNKNIVKEEEADLSWDILWDEKYKGNILMFDNSRDAFGISLLRLNKSVNSDNKEDWYNAAEELKKQKDLVQAYVMDQIFDKMGNGEAAIAPYYSGDAATLLKNNPDIGFVIPKNGTLEFVDAMCIPKNSEHPYEAEQYINFLCETEIAKANIEYIGYSTPQIEVKKLLDAEIVNNEMYYPSDQVLDNAQVFNNLGDDINSYLDELWVEVKAGSDANSLGLIIVLFGFIAIYLFVVIYKKKQI